MFRIMLVYGVIAGVLMIAVIAIGVQLNGGDFSDGSQLQGYLIMILASSLIFVGVKRYRDNTLGGVIKFWPALKLALGIAVVACVSYVLAWEVYLAVSGIDFAGQYMDSMRASYEAEGLSGEALQAKLQPMQDMMALYEKPWFRMPLTLLEPLPVCLVVALISAALLRNPKVFPAQA